MKSKRVAQNITGREGSSRHYRFYPTIATDKNLLNDGPGGTDSNIPCCEIVVLTTAGDLVVTKPDGTNVTIEDVPVGLPLPIQAIALVAAGTTAAGVLVLW